jgi:hypothetical protein
MKKVGGFLLGLVMPFAAVIIAPFMALYSLISNVTDTFL